MNRTPGQKVTEFGKGLLLLAIVTAIMSNPLALVAALIGIFVLIAGVIIE